MTSNQIAYWNLQELKRHNQAMDRENARHNVAGEAETERHNRSGEMETGRHNIMQENLDAQRNLETQRHNIESEYSNLIGAYAARTSAGAAATNASVNRSMLPYNQGYVGAQTQVQEATANKVQADADLTTAKIPEQLYKNQTAAKELITWKERYVQGDEQRRQQIVLNEQQITKNNYEIATQPIKDIVNVVSGGIKAFGDAAKTAGSVAMMF